MTVLSSEQMVQSKGKRKMILAPTWNLLRVVNKDCIILTLVFVQIPGSA